VRYRLDRSTRLLRDGRVVVGGSPGRVLRLTAAGAELVHRVRAGDDVGGTSGADALLGRLLDAGLVHPLPDAAAAPHGARDVTVVVPVRDRPAGLARLLASLHEDLPGLRVVVVDDGSATPVEAQRQGVAVVRHERSRGPAAARNTGARHARTPLLAFVDSDCEVAPGWLATLLAHLGDEAIAAVAPRVRAADGHGILARYDALRSPLDMGAEPARVAPGTRLSYVPSAALVVRAAAFEQLGGFDESMRVGEDVDLVWRLVAADHVVRYEPAATVRHDVRPGLGAWLQQRVGYGTSAADLDSRHPGAVAPVLVSGWSAAVWALAVAGRTRLAAGLAGGTVVAMAARVPEVPRAEVARLVLGGHLGAGRQLAEATVRVWWPLALAASASSRRVRRLSALAGLTVVTRAWIRRDTAAADPPSRPAFAALTLADHVAYGAGVWWGCWRHRSLRALLPRIPTRSRAEGPRAAAPRRPPHLRP
jgi:mycofactocin system glycosyltransferase